MLELIEINNGESNKNNVKKVQLKKIVVKNTTIKEKNIRLSEYEQLLIKKEEKKWQKSNR